MSYRPVCDVWILARTKLKKDAAGNKQSYHGAYPAGFLHRARALLGVRRADPVLHVCGGMVRECLYRGFGLSDRTLDLDPKTKPDYLMDARRLGVGKGDLFPRLETGEVVELNPAHPATWSLWPAMMLDRPYTEGDHAEYDVPADVFPADLNDLLKRALLCVEPGGRVGVLDYLWPSPPTKLGKEVAVIAVGTGRNNRARWFTVFERLVVSASPEEEPTDETPELVAMPGTAGPAIAPDPTPTPSRRRRRTPAPEGRGSNVAAGEPIRGPGSAAIAPAVESLPTGADSPPRRRRRSNPASHAPSPAAPANASGLQDASGPTPGGPGEGDPALQGRGKPSPEGFTCERCKTGELKKGATIESKHDGKRRCGDCHRAVAGGLSPDPAEGCVACGGTSKNSNGGPCVPCQKRVTLARAAAKVADVCHGCKEGFHLTSEGMERYEPQTDHPNVWHKACWEQHKQRAEAAAVKNREERDRAEAREKGWPICGGCNRAVTPTQKNVDGRHAACGKPRPRRRRAAASTASGGGMDGGFDA